MKMILIALAGFGIGCIFGFAVGSSMKDSYYRDQARRFINRTLWRIKLGEITTADIDYI